MKFISILVLILVSLACQALEIYPYEPGLGTIYHANFLCEPMTLGVNSAGEDYLYLYGGALWNQYSFWTDGLPITGTAKLDANTLMVAMGEGTYSDGVYNFDLGTHQWAINEWFYWPNFLTYCAGNQKHYVGEREGLFYTANGTNWYRITELGSNPCLSLASFGNNLITNNGSLVWYSNDNGLTWQQANTSNLKGFRYSADGSLIYAIMAVGSDSDGIWSSEDFGATWTMELYHDNLSAIGPDFNGQIPLGWNQPNQNGNYLELWLAGTDLLVPLPGLNSPVKQLEIFPLVNTPSFYVINNDGLYWFANFLQTDNDDEQAPELQTLNLKVWPNPAQSALYLEFADKHEDVSIELYDLKGRRVFSTDKTKVQNKVLDLKLPDLPRAIYLLKVMAGKQSFYQKVLLRD